MAMMDVPEFNQMSDTGAPPDSSGVAHPHHYGGPNQM